MSKRQKDWFSASETLRNLMSRALSDGIDITRRGMTGVPVLLTESGGQVFAKAYEGMSPAEGARQAREDARQLPPEVQACALRFDLRLLLDDGMWQGALRVEGCERGEAHGHLLVLLYRPAQAGAEFLVVGQPLDAGKCEHLMEK